MQPGGNTASVDRWLEAAAGLLGDRPAVERWAARLPPGYRDRTTPAEFVEDLAAVDALVAASPRGVPRSGTGRLGYRYNLRLRAAEAEDPATLRLRRTGLEAVELTAVLPVLESFGLSVTEAVPQHVPAADGGPDVHFDDFGLRPTGRAMAFDLTAADRLVRAIAAAGGGEADVDGLNRLVVLAGLDWRQVVLLRGYRRLRRQAGVPWSDAELDAALATHPSVAAALVAFVEARLAGPAPASDAGRAARAARARTAVLDALGGVTALADDQILQGYLQLADATLRSNWWSGEPDTLVLKIDSSRVAELPRPRPHVEAFVHGPDVEGVHLRMGAVARGGIRWSDRPTDFRTEVLGLAAAQTKKNAIIVPTGAKGGFIARRAAPGDAEAVLAAYRRYITGLLEVTDDIRDGAVAHPDGVVATDGDDPYLVVAADKGTATYSDDANAISEGRRFWLGDAFASGGSHGYDHKAMGITARGAWVAVRRHFRQLGIDVQREPITVAGVGDMSGDVFGNGMVRSRALRLVAAFDHRHIFIDPDPDPAVSYGARVALATRGRSSWADYDMAALSEGGGVWSREAKEIELSPQARAALGVSDAVLRPPEIVTAILTAPVDLLWFGGIGTFVKDVGESDTEVGDHANDAVRVTADLVRARVIAEGGNLGITQRARIRYSRRGGRVNADFIDNAAGVATSDREVNLKILLGLASDAGRLAPGDRDRLLVESTDEVAEEVLRQVDHSVAALDRTVPDSAAQLDAYVALLRHLEAVGLVDRSVESLPDDEELAGRRAAGAGLIRPELAGLLAFAKSDLVRALVVSPLVSDPGFSDAVVPYFPTSIRAVAGDLVGHHRLYAQLVATDVAGELVDHVGPVWAHETATELGRPMDEVAAAFWAARQSTGAGAAWAALEAAAHAEDPLDADTEAELHARVVAAVTALARATLRRGGPVQPAVLIAAGTPPLPSVAPAGSLAGDTDATAVEVTAAVVAVEVTAAVVAVEAAAAEAMDLRPIAAAARCVTATAAAALDALDALPVMVKLTELVTTMPVGTAVGRWSAWQARALADDLADVRRRLATVLLVGVDAATDTAAEAVAAWAAGPGAGALARAGSVAAAASAVPGSADAHVVAGLMLRILTTAPIAV
jgi:glutamate dehydrogenase